MDLPDPDFTSEPIANTVPVPTAPPAVYHDTRVIKIGGTDCATEFHGYSVDEVMCFMTFMQTLSSDAMSTTFPTGDRP